jgi:GNAT superfamily N-acetyltransferase
MQAKMVRTITAADEVRAIDTIVVAFAADPIARWCWPDSHQYLTSMPDFTRAFGGGAFLHNGAHSTHDYAGAALWLSPNVHSDEEALARSWSAQFPHPRATISSECSNRWGLTTRKPHWYLPMIGVDPPHQGKGYGGALLKYGLEQCDRDHIAAYLESTNPRNIPLHQRHGFEVLGKIQVGSSPPLIPMLRAPR